MAKFLTFTHISISKKYLYTGLSFDFIFQIKTDVQNTFVYWDVFVSSNLFFQDSYLVCIRLRTFKGLHCTLAMSFSSENNKVHIDVNIVKQRATKVSHLSSLTMKSINRKWGKEKGRWLTNRKEKTMTQSLSLTSHYLSV